MSINPNMANREVVNAVFCDYKTQVPFLNMDYANTSTTELTGESVFAYGGWGHPKRITYYGERGGTIVFETQIQPFKLYSLMTGGEISASAKLMRREELVASQEKKLTLSATPDGNVVNVFAANDDCGEPVESSVSGTEVTLTTGTAGSKYIVYYLESKSSGVKKINIKNTTFPKAFTVYAETTYKTEDDEIVPYKMVAYKVSPQSNMSIAYSNTGDPATLTLTCDLLIDGDGNMLDLILIEE